MAIKFVDEADLTVVGNAIRAKTGGSDLLTFPEGMAAAIAGISGGGGDDGSFKAVIERTAVNPTLPSDLTKIGSFAFGDYNKLTMLSIPAGVTSIGNHAFDSCANLALTSLPVGVTNIGDYAFYSCSKLALTEIPDGVTNIGSYAFRYCYALTILTFRGTPIVLSQTAFQNCTKLTTINVPWAEGAVTGAPWGATNVTINYNYTGG